MPKSLFSSALLATIACFVLASFADNTAEFIDFIDAFSADLEDGDVVNGGYGLPPPYDYGTPVVISTATSTTTDSPSVSATTIASDVGTSSTLAITASANGTVTLHNLTSTLTLTRSWSTAVSGNPSNETKNVTLTDDLPPVQTSVGIISVHAPANQTQSVHWSNSTTSTVVTSVSDANGSGATVTITYTVSPTGFPASSLVHTPSTSARPVNETVTITLWPTLSHVNTTVSPKVTVTSTSPGTVQSDVFSITEDSSSWLKSSVLGTAISSSGSVSSSHPGVTLTTTVTHYGPVGVSSSVEAASTSESPPYSVSSTQDADATSAHESITVTEPSSSEATPVIFTRTQFITVTQFPSASNITDKSPSLATASTIEQASASTTKDSSIATTSSEAVSSVTATGATVTVTVTDSRNLPNITATAVPPYPVGNSTCSHATTGAYVRPTGEEEMCITITDSSAVATECFTVLPIVSTVTGEVITPSHSARATVFSTSSSHSNSATTVPTTFATFVSRSISSSTEQSIPTRLPPSPNFPWGGDSPAHRHQNAATVSAGLRVRRFFTRL